MITKTFGQIIALEFDDLFHELKFINFRKTKLVLQKSGLEKFSDANRSETMTPPPQKNKVTKTYDFQNICEKKTCSKLNDTLNCALFCL